MELKSGNVQSLARDGFFTGMADSSNALLHQMLQALDYLANHEIIHRDVRPENILYTLLPDGKYLYQLADFGLANIVDSTQTPAGTLMFMAPEAYLHPSWPQTSKMDVWSLFVTLAYVMNVAGFRRKAQGTPRRRAKAIREAAKDEKLQRVQAMVIEYPDDRAAAGYILEKVYGGEGRTTPR